MAFEVYHGDCVEVMERLAETGRVFDAGLDYVGIDNLEEYATKTRERLGKFESLKNGA